MHLSDDYNRIFNAALSDLEKSAGWRDIFHPLKGGKKSETALFDAAQDLGFPGISGRTPDAVLREVMEGRSLPQRIGDAIVGQTPDHALLRHVSKKVPKPAPRPAQEAAPAATAKAMPNPQPAAEPVAQEGTSLLPMALVGAGSGAAGVYGANRLMKDQEGAGRSSPHQITPQQLQALQYYYGRGAY